MNEDRFIKVREVIRLTSMSRSVIRKAELAGAFPQAVRLGRVKAWSHNEIQQYIQQKLESRNAESKANGQGVAK